MEKAITPEPEKKKDSEANQTLMKPRQSFQSPIIWTNTGSRKTKHKCNMSDFHLKHFVGMCKGNFFLHGPPPRHARLAGRHAEDEREKRLPWVLRSG